MHFYFLRKSTEIIEERLLKLKQQKHQAVIQLNEQIKTNKTVPFILQRISQKRETKILICPTAAPKTPAKNKPFYPFQTRRVRQIKTPFPR